ncbi:hypothetical protein EV401DRAFT_2074373 [Pisolithus croceorrhizus]|nr:hypothetical protein EV401DRAFT_2074373 [Pisolithus croceorrhizus]
MSAPPVMTFPAQCHGFAPRSGPLGSPPDTLQAYSLTLQCPFDVCSGSYGLPRRRIYGKSPLVHYLPSRRNRQCSGIPAGHNKFLHSDIFAALKQFCVLVVVFLVLRVVSDTALYVCRSPFHFKSMPCRTVPPSCESSEPTPTTAAVLRFISDQIKLANSIAMSSTSLGLGFHELLEEDQANLKALQRTSLFTEKSHLLYGRGLSGVNVTELLYTPLIDFTPRGFIGRTFTYALDELERLCTLPCPDYSYTRGEDHSIRALAVYHRISSTLLLEYSAAQPRVIRLLDALQTTRRLVSMVAQRDDGPQVYETRRSWRRRNDYTFVTQQEAFSRLLARLDATIERLSLLVAHLDRITEELVSSVSGQDSFRLKSSVPQGHTAPEAEPSQCLTLEVDEETQVLESRNARISHLQLAATIHHGQFRILYRRYTDASKMVDKMNWDRQFPAHGQIMGLHGLAYSSREGALGCVNTSTAIRVETEGRHLHARRFVDEGHRARIRFLQQEMVNAHDALDKLHTRAYELYIPTVPCAHEIAKSADDSLPSPYLRPSRRTEELVAVAESDSRVWEVLQAERRTLIRVPETGNEDLIEIILAERKHALLTEFSLFMDPECKTIREETDSPCEAATEAVVEVIQLCYQQIARRIIFHEPTLFMKSLDKTSLDDFFQSSDFDVEDAIRLIDLFTELMGFTLKWCKDAVADALILSREDSEDTAAGNNTDDRLRLLGGYIFKPAAMTNEVWWYLLTLTSPPGDMEHRFLQICQNFDDLINFQSFCALGLVPPPTFCAKQPGPSDPSISRSHLSLCSVVVADMVSPRPTNANGPIPTWGRAKKRDCVVWSEHEARAHLFAAIKNESDYFTDAFIRELRARPDLFQVVIRSETDPEQVVEVFGASPGEELASTRTRTFEAPPLTPTSNPPKGDGEWEVQRTAVDLLYGTTRDNCGYLTTVPELNQKWLFRLKTFPVKYLVVLDAIPNRDHSHVARNLAWAALCARGYGEGEYTLQKYAEAGDRAVDERAEECFGWMPIEWTWSLPLMEERLEELKELEFGDV